MMKLTRGVSLLLLALLFPFLSFAQEAITGKVTDKNGLPLSGATVINKAGNSIQTSSNGTFTITVASKDKLTVSYVGFTTRTVAAAADLTIVLSEEAINLSEVVVTGLAGGIKRRNAANAVTRLSAKELTGSTRPPTLDAAMNGKVSGAVIAANTGAPGGGMSIRLRGVSTVIGSSEPLYVIDGIIVNNSQLPSGAGTNSFSGAVGANAGSEDQAPNRISDINPGDIESIDILKGPSAAAAYGTRANGGVIVITTRRGKSGKTRINVSQDVGMSRALKLLGSENWTEEKINNFDADNGSYALSKDRTLELFRAANGQTWDYEKLIWGNTGLISNTNATVSGGTDKTRFLIAGSMQSETGIQKHTGYKRHSIRLNLDHKLTDFIDLKLSTNYLNTNTSRGFAGNDNNGVALAYSIAHIPNFINLNKTADGKYPESPNTGQNPFEVVDRAENRERTNRFLYSGEMNVWLLRKERSSLKLGFRSGIDFILSEPRAYMPEDMQFQSGNSLKGATRYSLNKIFYTYLQTSLAYNVNVGKNIDLTTSAVVLRDDQRRDISWIQGDGLLGGQRNPSTGQRVITESLVEKEAVVALDLSQDINWDDKVIGRVGVRADKSTLAGLNFDKWFYFPRASLAVNLTNFAFWNVAPVTMLKPRIAYGQTSGFPTFNGAYSRMSPINYGGQLGVAAPVTLGLSRLEPERATELEFGFDLGLFGNRVVLEATYYKKKIQDFLFPFTLSAGTGVSSLSVFPVGDMENKGVELGLNAAIIRRKDIEWSTNIQWWFNKSLITRLDVPPAFVGSSGFGSYGRKRLVQGQSPTLWYGPDENKTLVPYKEAQPKFQMSWGNTVRFGKGFEFGMFWHTSQGGHNASLTKLLKDEGGTTHDYSQPGKEDVIGRERQAEVISNFIFDASFIRLREASLYYTIPESALKSILKKGPERVRVGISGSNLLLITDYYGYDPEASNFNTSNAGGALSTGVDLAPHPAVRRFFFHLNFEF
ncbi:SusC/RagA family TonB-linked outer membrane protein [Pseudoflavitalea rhizosphaerae]|uniref:SusC/RagA family TonB-linked outer membrane protein n=1 Tax=Pseudoflavitalea rhizosphaerae TaxID=1884793 RepID=UPI000F8DAEB3|nr:SusC/RagA family TonB-linked outer membrane protein [Pseudoflavitalea rhizosphaerae]